MTQKLTLKISSQVDDIDVLQLENCSLCVDYLHKLLCDNKMKVPPDGSIVDAGTKGNLRIFFTNLIKKIQLNVHMPLLLILRARYMPKNGFFTLQSSWKEIYHGRFLVLTQTHN